MFKNKIAFTIIEMIIVVIIIGIISSVLIPGILGFNERTRDLKRKFELHEVANILEKYRLAHGRYPTGCGALDNISQELESVGLQTTPKDPKNTQIVNAIQNVPNGEYGYCNVGYTTPEDQAAYILLSRVERISQSNYIWSANRGNILEGSTTIIGGLILCAAECPKNEVDLAQGDTNKLFNQNLFIWVCNSNSKSKLINETSRNAQQETQGRTLGQCEESTESAEPEHYYVITSK